METENIGIKWLTHVRLENGYYKNVLLFAVCWQSWSNEARAQFMKLVNAKNLYAVIMDIDPVSALQHLLLLYHIVV